jgi:uncharacterized protein YdaU (DUF1376 family)
VTQKPPAFQFYAKDWLTSKAVISMSAVQRGYYIHLLAHSWDSPRPGYLQDDPELLWKLAGAKSRKHWEKDAALVLAQFPKAGRGIRVNRRLAGERKAQVDRSSRYSSSGLAGAKARWDSKLHGNAIETPMAENGSSSSSSSSSSFFSLTPKDYRAKNALAHDPNFEKFWESYPRKVGKVAAEKKWKKLSPPLPVVLEWIEAYRETEQWADEQFIPHPATFLNQRRWEDPKPQKAESPEDRREREQKEIIDRGVEKFLKEKEQDRREREHREAIRRTAVTKYA